MNPSLTAILDDLMPAAQRLAARRRRRRRTLSRARAVAATLALASSVATRPAGAIGRARAAGGQARSAHLDRGHAGRPPVEPRRGACAHAVAAADGSPSTTPRCAGGGYCAELVTAGERARGAVCSAPYAPRAALGDDPVHRSGAGGLTGHGVGGRVPPRRRLGELVYPDGATIRSRLVLRALLCLRRPGAHLAPCSRRAAADRPRRGRQRARPGGRTERRDHAPEGGGARARPDRARHGQHRRRPHEGPARARRRPCPRRRPRHPPLPRRRDRARPAARAALRPRRAPRPPGRLHAPGTVAALGADGRVLARRPVAAVAYWHARDGG